MAEPQASRNLVPGNPDADRYWLTAAIDLSRRCLPSQTAFSVGAILVGAGGEVIATGYSREVDPMDHAEEVALRRAAEPCAGTGTGTGDVRDAPGPPADLRQATLYSSLEPCVSRASRPVSCAELVAAAGLRRVVIAWREPPLFVPGGGAAWLAGRGVTVIERPELAAAARSVNQHLLPR
jgi:diaminohydroxyphosphoribosylaminopyrimidine deaminase / 5-amino-6-(5-phosphoribosylamino)uracil reductase